MFELFPWNPMLETGIEAIDAQHRRLVALLNRLARVSVGEADPAATSNPTLNDRPVRHPADPDGHGG